MELDASKKKIEQIAQALRGVPARIPDRDESIPFTHCIPGAAREIYLAWRPPKAPARKPSEWHNKFQTNAKKLLALLAEMPMELIEDVFQNFEQKSQLYQHLNCAFGNSMFARSHEAGRPASSESKRLAIVVANFYFNLAGRRPTLTRHPITSESGGEFYTLLDSIFKILEVEDDPRTAAEFVRKHWHAIDKAPGSVAGIEHILPPKRRPKTKP
jgi:hypothetical protein